MSLAVVYSRACLGIQAPLVTVETHISNGLPGFTIVGLPATAVKESKDRVRSAIINSGFQFPQRRLTINLAPADLPKDGGRFDLPIALGILAASEQISCTEIELYEFVGELALSGELRSIHGTLPLALGSREAKRILILPLQNADEASLPGDNKILPANNLTDVCQHLSQEKILLPHPRPDHSLFNAKHCYELDLSDVHGQPMGKRALEIAAAGGHSLLMIGPPGTGKTMLASRLPTIMPPLTIDETLEVIAIYSLLPHKQQGLTWGRRPFRAPHHTASGVALVGGGSNPRPGEISLAHHGVLFLDELPEFDRKVLEVLREPLESGTILISRAARQAEFPARFQLVAAMNPCPCGYLNDPKGLCQCTQEQISRYRTRVSGPLLDRIDMHIEVSALPVETLIHTEQDAVETSANVAKRVESALIIQRKRSDKPNARLSNREILEYSSLCKTSEKFMSQAMEKLGLSARSYHRVIKLARTIADLAESEQVQIEHLYEALSFRKIDRVQVFG